MISNRRIVSSRSAKAKKKHLKQKLVIRVEHDMLQFSSKRRGAVSLPLATSAPIVYIQAADSSPRLLFFLGKRWDNNKYGRKTYSFSFTQIYLSGVSFTPLISWHYFVRVANNKPHIHWSCGHFGCFFITVFILDKSFFCYCTYNDDLFTSTTSSASYIKDIQKR